MIRLIATDLDGTLLDSEGGVPEANRRALRVALERGVRLVLATARKASSTAAVAGMLGLPCARIAHNGARTWDWDGVERRHFRVSLDLADRIARYADAHGLGLITTVDEVNYYAAAARSRGLNPEDVPVRTNVEAVVAAPTRIIAVGRPGIDLLCAEFSQDFDSMVLHRYYSRDGALESAVITHPRATKADALSELCAAYALQPAHVLALGDAEADAEMLRWAGVGVAMGNAMREAYAAADWIAPSHDEAGFAAAIERYVLHSPQGFAHDADAEDPAS